MATGIKRLLSRIRGCVHSEVAANIDRGSLYSPGLAWEGYDGGYIDALDDVTNALNGVVPDRWKKWLERDGERIAALDTQPGK